MKKHVYAIFDKVGKVYHNPWIEACDATAARAFTLACSDKNSLYGMAPADFILYHIGTFDDKLGIFDTEISAKILDGRDMEVIVDE